MTTNNVDVSKEVRVKSRRITQARAQLLVNHPFFGHLALYLEPKAVVGLDFGTMATDGKYLYYDPDGKMNEWTNEQLMGAIAHEVFHCAFGHMWRIGQREQKRWNYATDYAINWIITQEANMELPPDCLLSSEFANMSAEHIYGKLADQKDKGDKNGQKSLDDGKIWKEATEGKNGDDDGEGDGNGDGESGEDGDQPGSGREMSKQQEKFWEEKVVAAAAIAKSQGKLPAGLGGLIKDLVNPKLDWKQLLREAVQTCIKNDYRTSPFNKRYLGFPGRGSGTIQPLYLPSLQGEHMEVVVALDTSGSVSDLEARQFLSEMRGIAEEFSSYEIHFMQCDAMVHSYEILTNGNEDDWPMRIAGRGGTSFRPPFEKVDELGLQPPIFIYLTDLMGDFPPDPGYPTLWITSRPGHAPFGEVIEIDIEGMPARGW